MGGSICFNW